MKRMILFALLTVTIAFTACQQDKKTKVACIGDSITVTPRENLSYPVTLDSLLGDRFAVMNLGHGGTTMLKDGDFPYWSVKEFSNAFAFEPDLIIIKLGTNDTKPQNWNAEKFYQSYQSMIDTFRTISTNPKIFVCLPVPAFETKYGINDSIVVNGVIPAVKKIAKENDLPIIDLYNSMLDKGEMFYDSIHPNAEGAAVMAEIIADQLR